MSSRAQEAQMSLVIIFFSPPLLESQTFISRIKVNVEFLHLDQIPLFSPSTLSHITFLKPTSSGGKFFVTFPPSLFNILHFFSPFIRQNTQAQT